MIIRKLDQPVDMLTHVQGGEGIICRRQFLLPEDSCGAGRLFAVFTLAPGDSIGYHKHTGDYELYYILKGKAKVTDGDREEFMEEGDMMLCRDGGSHSIEAVGEEPMEFLAEILFPNERGNAR